MARIFSDLSTVEVFKSLGFAGLFGRMLRDWLEPEGKKMNPEESMEIAEFDISQLQLMYTRVAELVKKNNTSIKPRHSLNEQWVPFEQGLLALIRYVANTPMDKRMKVVLKFEGGLWKSNFYTLETRSVKNDRVISMISIYGLN